MTSDAARNPLEELDAMISDGNASALLLTSEDGVERGARRSPGAPLDAILARQRGAHEIASAAPPLTGLIANIELARETMRQLETGELEASVSEEDPLRLLRAREEGVSGAASNRAPSPQPVASPPPTPPPRAASVDVGVSREDAPGLEGSELQISQLLLDALASQPLSGDARARAAGALAAGIARNDANALKAALAILVTGE